MKLYKLGTRKLMIDSKTKFLGKYLFEIVWSVECEIFEEIEYVKKTVY